LRDLKSPVPDLPQNFAEKWDAGAKVSRFLSPLCFPDGEGGIDLSPLAVSMFDA